MISDSESDSGSVKLEYGECPSDDEVSSHKVEGTKNKVLGRKSDCEIAHLGLPQMPPDGNNDEELTQWEPRLTPARTPTPDVTPAPKVPKTDMAKLEYYDRVCPAANVCLLGAMKEGKP